mmetsp:Transcript_35437/g.46655  ORF Transcript_35437/g.46655 Transcript_35437/m.46655 type:complete len:134 (-) Transcript_35437:959-1360(-)
MPALPTMSLAAVQHDQELERKRMMGDLMLVSNDRNVQGDLYMESDAEEIYLPENQRRGGPGFKRNGQSLVTEDEAGIIGYQKYMHIVNRLAVDNTDAQEPRLPEISHFLRVSKKEQAQELQRARELGLPLETY